MRKMFQQKNIVLIGMPGAGKSTLGVLLAKLLVRDYLDLDLVIQRRELLSLQEIIDARGLEAFRAIEEQAVLSLGETGYVIATGGSVVYSEPAMRHLRDHGIIVYLKVALNELERRLTNLASRGVVMAPGQTLDGLYHEREPLYERYADVAVETVAGTHEHSLARLLEALAAYEKKDS